MPGESDQLHYIPGVGQSHERLYALKDMFIPVLLDTITPGTPDPPFDTAQPAIGAFGDTQYTWDVAAQVWKQTGRVGTLSDIYTVEADGSDSVFSWEHGLGFDPTPTGYTIDAQTAPAQGIYSKSANGTNFIVTYDVCPVGTLIFNWTAKQP